MAIVRYTEEELKKMPSLTDWERVLNMKDDDIAEDVDNPEWTDEMCATAVRGGVPVEQPQRVSIYLRPSLVKDLNRTGKDWRKRLSENFERWLRQNVAL
jgi:hypothetical protein